MSFISFENDKFFHDDEAFEQLPMEERICKEILNSNRIMHIYIVMPENTAICVEYLSKKGDWFEIHETFENEVQCRRRFIQLENILKEGN